MHAGPDLGPDGDTTASRKGRIVLVVSGTRGDVQPLIAFGAGLERAGRDVLLCASPENAAMAAQFQCPFLPFGDDVEAFAATVPEPALSPIAATHALVAFIKKQTLTQLQELPDIIKDADLVLGAVALCAHRHDLIHLVAGSVARARGVQIG